MCKITGIVTLWRANEGFKVLRPSGFEIFQFFSIAPEIFANKIFSDKIMKFNFSFMQIAELLYKFIVVIYYDAIKL